MTHFLWDHNSLATVTRQIISFSICLAYETMFGRGGRKVLCCCVSEEILVTVGVFMAEEKMETVL